MLTREGSRGEQIGKLIFRGRKIGSKNRWKFAREGLSIWCFSRWFQLPIFNLCSHALPTLLNGWIFKFYFPLSLGLELSQKSIRFFIKLFFLSSSTKYDFIFSDIVRKRNYRYPICDGPRATSHAASIREGILNSLSSLLVDTKSMRTTDSKKDS